ncbi:hypothetical protein EO062_22080 [Salmonella enterica subsp. enterica serovar Senftenberg]|nr:hypothetical protein [Salmonella enterica subsp. enterica serovar Senftenberg]ECA7080074.1 hypothetical protein [Salmonella enterica subsp. enterica serovar Senftenberg]
MITMLKILPKTAMILLAFLAIFLIEWYTPIHSDDYRYYLLGISPESHFHHYMTWSGRIIADYTSALILYTRSQLVYSISAAVSTLVFCYFIVKTPSGTLRWNKSDYLLFPLIFFTYWISNPNLGQTTFWIVGAANYLWTNLFVVTWLFFFYTITIKNSKAISPWVALLSFMAGCSNESVSPFVSLISVLAIAYELWQNKSVSRNKIVYSLCAIAGSCVLILSPGNFIRASGKEFWYGRPIFERIFIHLTERVHNHLALIWIAYVVLLLLVLLVIFNKQIRAKIDKTSLICAALVVCIGISTSLIMFASPSYPDRVMNGTFMFFLLAISFIAYALLKSGVKAGVVGVTAVTVLCGIVFLWSYSLMLNGYKKTAGQEIVRQEIITKEIAAGKQKFIIPDYYFVKLQNSGGHFGLFHDPAVYGEYYHVQAIFKKKVNFDYSVIANGAKHSLSNETTAYSNTRGDFAIISREQLTGSITLSVNGRQKTIPVEKMKHAEINDEFWYYASVGKGEITAISF